MAAAAMYRTGRHEPEPENNANDTRDTLFLLGGLSLMVFGAGLVMTSPLVRKLLGGSNVGGLLQTALPDLERYMKIRAL
jgi:hypothetical protein